MCYVIEAIATLSLMLNSEILSFSKKALWMLKQTFLQQFLNYSHLSQKLFQEYPNPSTRLR